MVPMTKEEYEKQQAQVKRVYDPETGRHRWENRQHWGEQIWIYMTASYQLSTPQPPTQRFFSFLLIRVISMHCPVIQREEKVWKEIIVSSLKHVVNEYFNGMNPLCIWNWEDQYWSRFVSVVTRKTSYWCQWLFEVMRLCFCLQQLQYLKCYALNSLLEILKYLKQSFSTDLSKALGRY